MLGPLPLESGVAAGAGVGVTGAGSRIDGAATDAGFAGLRGGANAADTAGFFAIAFLGAAFLGAAFLGAAFLATFLGAAAFFFAAVFFFLRGAAFACARFGFLALDFLAFEPALDRVFFAICCHLLKCRTLVLRLVLNSAAVTTPHALQGGSVQFNCVTCVR